jgi:rRNA maturation endonuclease Nob1
MRDKTRDARLLARVARERGYRSVRSMLEAAVVDHIAPGICLSCHAVCEDIEPDQTEGYCESCGKNRIISALILAGIN